jgi:hypothetical protein
MRRRHSAQGVRNDLNSKLGLPKRAGWGDYLRSRGLKPDTVHNWFEKYSAVKTLGLLVSGTTPRKVDVEPATTASTVPRLYRVTVPNRVLVVSAASAKQAMVALHKSMDGLSDEDARVEEMGQVIEILNGRIRQRQTRQIPIEREVSEKAILKALTGHPGASPAAIAQRLGVSAVDVRRVATKHRQRLSK